MELGNPGDCKSLGGGLFEMRVDYGAGYRVYFVWRRTTVVILICGGEKRSQQQDINRARALAEKLE
jgi:putative addiction module killer protein